MNQEPETCFPLVVDCSIINAGMALRVQWQDGSSDRFHAIWLRDNSPDESTRDSHNGQRLISIDDLNPDLLIRQAGLQADGTLRLLFSFSEHVIDFDPHWLFAHRYDTNSPAAQGWVPAAIECWDSGMQSRIPQLDYSMAESDPARLRAWLAALQRFGFAKLTAGPEEEGAVLKVADLFGYVRETNYGKLFDVRTQANPVNLAYTGLPLQAHTDNPYRDPVPTLQILYCLQNSASGGDSTVVDGFAVAQRMRQETPVYFQLLSQYCANFEYRGDHATCLRARKPVIELAPDGELVAIRFNNRSSAAITGVPYDVVPCYYRALRRFSELLDDKQMQVEFKLQPGDCFVVDNTRVLHGRTGYTAAGSRWLQGCYADKDGLLSTLAVLQSRPDNTLPSQ